MSRETQQWLDEMILVGFTAEEHGRGEAWHRREGNGNSFPHEVPYERAYELIGSWEPVKVLPHYHDLDSDTYKPLKGYDGKSPVALIHSGNGYYLGTHSDRYADHGYRERLFDGLENILDASFTSHDDRLMIGSAGLLDGYRKAWVQLELPDSITHSSGESYRPFITAASSLDGSLANTYLMGVTRVVCDNTLDLAVWGATSKYKFKSTTNSGLKIASAREALGIIFKISEEFTAEMERLQAQAVSDRQFDNFLKLYVPLTNKDGSPKTGRSHTMAKNKIDLLSDTYHGSPMVAPWKGTAWGVAQAVNTYAEHLSIVKGMSREERNVMSFLKGDAADRDREALEILTAVLR